MPSHFRFRAISNISFILFLSEDLVDSAVRMRALKKSRGLNETLRYVSVLRLFSVGHFLRNGWKGFSLDWHDWLSENGIFTTTASCFRQNNKFEIFKSSFGRLRQRRCLNACRTCSTIILAHSTIHIIDLWSCPGRCLFCGRLSCQGKPRRARLKLRDFRRLWFRCLSGSDAFRRFNGLNMFLVVWFQYHWTAHGIVVIQERHLLDSLSVCTMSFKMRKAAILWLRRRRDPS